MSILEKFKIASKPEKVNFLTHFFGFILFILISPILAVKGFPYSHTEVLFGVILFSVCLILMYLSSSVYHLEPSGSRKQLFRKFDHICIFLLIAGSYTPFVFIYFNDNEGINLLLIIWFIALLGSLFKLFFTGKLRFLSTLAYLFTGWAAVFIGERILNEMPSNVLFYIGLGGVFFSLGTIFYMMKKWNYSHSVWHIFVILGNLSHYYALWISV